MSPAEIAFRGCEQAKRFLDVGRRRSWDEFGRFKGPINSLFSVSTSVLIRADPCFRERAREIGQGKIKLLNQDWPPQHEWSDSIWHLDPVSGQLWPGKESSSDGIDYRHGALAGDVKFVWELNRLQVLQTLALAEEWTLVQGLLESWIRANPPYTGINWTSGIEAASRIVSLLVVYGLAPAKIKEQMDGRLRQCVEAHVERIARYPSLHSSANNHRIAELAALVLANACVPELPGGSAHQTQSICELERECLRQIYSDGVGAEQSPTYTAYSMEWLIIVGEALDETDQPFSPAVKVRIAEAASHLKTIMDDAGRVPRIGDDDEGRVLAFGKDSDAYVQEIVDRAERWLGRQTVKDGMQIFSEGGYSSFRLPTPCGIVMGLFDHAPLGFLSIAAHGHADALSFWMHWGNERIFIDAGTYLYHAGEDARDHFRGTPIHNTLCLASINQSRIGGAFNWTHHANTWIDSRTSNSVSAATDAYVARFGLSHQRKIEMSNPPRIVIEDRLVGRPRETNEIWSIGFMLDPDVTCTLRGALAKIATAKGRSLNVTVRAYPGCEWRLRQESFSPRFNGIERTSFLWVEGNVGQSRNATTEIVFNP